MVAARRATASARVAATATAVSASSRSTASSQARSAAAVLEQAVARAHESFERGDAPAVAGIQREREAIEKATAVPGGAAEQPVHVRGQPERGDVRAERRRGALRRPVDADGPPGLAGRRVEPRADLDLSRRRAKLGVNRPAGGPARPGELACRGAAQAAAWREQRDGLDQVGLAGPVRADEHDGAAVELKVELGVVAEIGEAEPAKRGRARHTRIGMST
jgi:hypothetical protein